MMLKKREPLKKKGLRSLGSVTPAFGRTTHVAVHAFVCRLTSYYACGYHTAKSIGPVPCRLFCDSQKHSKATLYLYHRIGIDASDGWTHLISFNRHWLVYHHL